DVTVAVIVFSPAVFAVTFTLKVQVMPAASGARLYVNAPEPGLTPEIPAMQGPVAENPTGLAITRPAGSVSLMTTPMSGMVFGFVTDNVNVAVPVTTILGGLNVFVR